MKLKYKYNVHSFLDAYPTEEDALFDIVNFLRERNKLADEWSDLGIKAALSKQVPEQELSALLTSLVKQNFLSMREGSGKRNYFKIINNPFV